MQFLAWVSLRCASTSVADSNTYAINNTMVRTVAGNACSDAMQAQSKAWGGKGRNARHGVGARTNAWFI